MTTASLANGKKLLRARIMEPATGNWTADVDIESEDPIEGEVFSLVSTVPFAGAVVRGSVDGGKWSGRIEGGRGNMHKSIRARAYTRATVGMVLADIAIDAKEKLSHTIAPGVLSRPLASWTRVEGTTQRAVADLAEKLEVNWRITRTGEIWIGQELYQPVIGLEYKQLSQGANDSAIIAPQSPGVSPGNLFNTRQVGDVITSLTADALEQTIMFHTDEKTGLAKVLERIVQRMIGRRVDFSGSYPARVVLQRGDDTLDVIMDHPRFRGDGLKNVPIRLGIPGARCEVKSGARVRIQYDEQDQSKPFASLWDTNPIDVTVIEVGAGTSFVTRDDLLRTYLEADKTWKDGHTHAVPAGTDGAGGITSVPSSTPAVGTPPTPSPTITPTASTTLKVQ
jgi:hypothetical protein